MGKISVLLIFSVVLLLFSSCGNISDSSEALSDSSATSGSSQIEEPFSSEPSYSDFSSQSSDNSILPAVLTDGDTSTVYSIEHSPYELELNFSEPLSLCAAELCGISENVLSISISVKDENGSFSEVYFQSEIGENRICFLGTVNSDCISISFDSSGGAVEIGELALLSSLTEETPFKTSAYLPVFDKSYDISKYASSFSLLSDVIFISGSAKWNENGEIIPGENLKSAIDAVRALPESENCKIWVSIAPQGSLIKNGTAGNSINSDEKISDLVSNILNFLSDYSIDAVDFDWEFPKDQTEWNDFGKLLRQLKLASPSTEISAAFYPYDIFLPDFAFSALDRVNIMAYDLFDDDGFHCTYSSAEKSIKYFLELGFESSQLFLGIPCYGRPTDRASVWNYYSDAEELFSSFDNLFDGSYYNGKFLVRDKAALAKHGSLGGIMLFHLLCDLPASHPASLLYSATDSLLLNSD